MKTPILLGTCAALLLGAAATTAEQQENPPASSAETAMPKFIACAQETGEPFGQCTYSIKRGETAKITVTVAFENGFKRRLFFKDGVFVKASTTMSGTGKDTDWSLEDGAHMIRVDDQRYRVPDTLISGN